MSRAGPLQFVSGLGIHKANHFLKEVKEKKVDNFTSKIHGLMKFSKGCFQDRIFINAALPLKIIVRGPLQLSHNVNSLDRTRIPIACTKFLL